MDLNGRTAIVTGGSGGIGRATAIALARLGADVVINYNHNEAGAAAVKKEIEKEGGSAFSIKADVSVYEECEALVSSTIDHFNRIDILINNAGITRDNLFVRMNSDEWHDVIKTNLTGAYNCCKAVLKPLLKQKSGGRIINIASVSGVYGNSGQANYAAAKAGIIGLTRSLAKELGRRNITVNAVAPGFIETEMTADLPDEYKQEIINRIALGRLGRPEDVADAVAFLAASGDYITGQVIIVDGSLSM